jgi:nucleoside phosphorylase
MVVRYGTIASRNLYVRGSEIRQQLNNDLGGVLCLETETASLINSFPCLVIRGICDYATLTRMRCGINMLRLLLRRMQKIS